MLHRMLHTLFYSLILSVTVPFGLCDDIVQGDNQQADVTYSAERLQYIKNRVQDVLIHLDNDQDLSTSMNTSSDKVLQELDAYIAEAQEIVCTKAEEWIELIELVNDLTYARSKLQGPDAKASSDPIVFRLDSDSDGIFDDLVQYFEGKEKKLNSRDEFADMVKSEFMIGIMDRVEKEGWTEELVQKLIEYAEETNDPSALEKLVYIELFKTQEPHFTQLFHRNSSALSSVFEAYSRLNDAKEKKQTAAVISNLLDIVHFRHGENSDLSSSERANLAKDTILSLANSSMVATPLLYLVAGNQLRSADISDEDTCEAAVEYYEFVASTNKWNWDEDWLEAYSKAGVLLADVWESHIATESSSWFSLRKTKATFADNDASAVNPKDVQVFEYFLSLTRDPRHEAFPMAAQYVGDRYLFGDERAGVMRDENLAASYFRKAAEAGNANAQYAMASLLMEGTGVEQDNSTAIEYLQKAADQNNGHALYGLGMLYRDGAGGLPKNSSLAVYYLELARTEGMKEAYAPLGMIYLHGNDDIEPKHDLAFQYLNTAEYKLKDTASPNLLHTLGAMHFKGLGTEPNCQISLEYFRRAALHSTLVTFDLPFSLDKAYRNFQQKDYQRAYLNYRLLAELGSELAQMNAAFLLEKFGHAIESTGLWKQDNEILRASEQALGLYKDAAKFDELTALRALAECYETSSLSAWKNVCDTNVGEAALYYQRAAALGDHQASFRLAAMYALSGNEYLQEAKISANQCARASYPHNVPCMLLQWVLDLKTFALGSIGAL